ncbi:hypothetical protein SLA2020_451250 [Shorea laevis]
MDGDAWVEEGRVVGERVQVVGRGRQVGPFPLPEDWRDDVEYHDWVGVLERQRGFCERRWQGAPAMLRCGSVEGGGRSGEIECRSTLMIRNFLLMGQGLSRSTTENPDRL